LINSQYLQGEDGDLRGSVIGLQEAMHVARYLEFSGSDTVPFLPSGEEVELVDAGDQLEYELNGGRIRIRRRNAEQLRGWDGSAPLAVARRQVQFTFADESTLDDPRSPRSPSRRTSSLGTRTSASLSS
jgi:hypothetical protein